MIFQVVSLLCATGLAAARGPAKDPFPKYNSTSTFINSTYEDIAINGVEPVTVYQPLKYNQGLFYDGWYAYSYPEELQDLPIPRPYGKITAVGNNGSTITPVHLYSNFTSIKPLSAAFAVMIDTNSINAIPVVGEVIVKAYKRAKYSRELELISATSCPFTDSDEGRLEYCKFPKEWKEVVLLEFAVRAEGYVGMLSDLISAAQASFNLQAFIPDVVPPGTVGFLMDNFCFQGEEEYDDGDGDEYDGGNGDEYDDVNGDEDRNEQGGFEHY